MRVVPIERAGPGFAPPPGPVPGAAFGGGWQGLRTLTRARLLVASLALPLGVMFRPDAGDDAWWVLSGALFAVGLLSALFWFGVRLRRGLGLQTYLQLSTDLALVTWLSARTGGRDSQFLLFFALVVVTGGLIGRVAGGLFAAGLACAAILLLPLLVAASHGEAVAGLRSVLPLPMMLPTFLVLMGVLSGILGLRVQHARAELARTAAELARVRIDNDVILRHLTTGVPPRLDPLRAAVEHTIEDRTPRARLELLVTGASGAEQPLGISTNPLVHLGQVTGVVAVFQDLTEAREMERRARRNQTLAEVGALAAGIAHELRNGLKPISGSIEFLQRELKPRGESAVLMDLIGVECNRLNRFITDLLNYSRERDLAPEPIEIGEHLAELCEGLSRDPGRPSGVTVSCEPGPPGVRVRGDREQLRQVWLNLSNNAFEAMPEGGTLSLRWRDEGGARIVIEFEDSGPGIPPEDVAHVGRPFFTTKEKGTGLGIAIAQRIVERHGGVLSFDSRPGEGTIARVALPRAEQPAALAA